jgi:tRNA nucleotidyltransferase (CCA-adding enzyme)
LAHTLKASEKAIKWYTLLHLDQPMNSWIVYWMALMDTLPKKAIRDTHQRLQFPQHQAKKLRWIGRKTASAIQQLSKSRKQQPSHIYRALCDFPDEVLIFLMAKVQSETVKQHLSAFLKTYRHIHPILNGTDLKRMGLKPGPQFRSILDKLLDARLNGEVKTESDEWNLIKQLIKTT